MLKKYKPKKHKLELMREALQTIKDKDRIQQTMQDRKSYNQRIRRHIPELMIKNFITSSGDKKNGNNYSLTKRGIAYLNNYDMIMAFTTSFGII